MRSPPTASASREAFTHSPITNTSHITILTGLLPSVHGVTDFAVPLSPQHVNWAELLKKQGYQTAAFIGAVILDSNTLAPGLDRGFDFYDNFPAQRRRWQDERALGTRRAPRHGSRRSTPNPGSTNTAPDLISSGSTSTIPTIPTSRRHPSPKNTKTISTTAKSPTPIPRSANCIAYLKKSGAYDNAIIIVTGDHGEGLGEHGEDTHGLFLYDSTLHVPLIMKTPAAAHHGTVIDAQVRTTDILPTILSATNMAAPAELNGESLVPLIDAERPSQPRAVWRDRLSAALGMGSAARLARATTPS